MIRLLQRKKAGKNVPLFRAADLSVITIRIFQAAGVPDSTARCVADSLVEANLTGHDSHGVIRITEYLKKIREGRIDPQAEPEIIHQTSTTLRVNGHWGFGQVVAGWTMERVIDKAIEQNLAAGSILHCGHIGRVGAYTCMGAERGLVALAFANGGGKQPRVAPFNGVRPVFGTNPLAAAVPVDGQLPIVLDFSTSVVASGKIRVARDNGEDLPEGWILDREGKPTCHPQAYYDGGMLLPAAGHKGYALSLLVEVLGGLLSGAGTLLLPETDYEVGNGVFFLVLKVEAFRPLAEFTSEMCQLGKTIKATPPAVEGSEVLLPGEPEQRTKAHRLAEGIDVSDVTWQAIVKAARSLGVELKNG
ncbi:Ldh family oxidoreductase [Acidobacteria bacterium AH-259-D05]|nr:Ldh family oxidoreductase [Acidobacteria bacterium AH-259-D05]